MFDDPLQGLDGRNIRVLCTQGITTWISGTITFSHEEFDVRTKFYLLGHYTESVPLTFLGSYHEII